MFINQYSQRGAAENFVTIHYHRPDSDYGDYSSTDYNDYWGLHTWNGAATTVWTSPLKPLKIDNFGLVFNINLLEKAYQEIKKTES